jgi:hypothetical protein
MTTDRPVIVVNPAAEDAGARQAAAPRLIALAGARIAFIDNSKHNADAFLDALQARLLRDYGVRSVERYRKASPSVPTPPEVLNELLTSCDALVHGVAD